MTKDNEDLNAMIEEVGGSSAKNAEKKK